MGDLPENHPHEPDETRLAQLAGAYTDALVAGDEIAAEIAVREAMDADLTTAEIDEKVIAPALWLIGELRERMVENLVRGGGYDVVMLGPDVPAATIAAAARHHEAHVLCLSSTMPGRRDEVLGVIDEVRRAWPTAAFVLGGRGLTVEDQMRAQVQVCAGVTDAMETVDAAIKHAGLN